jgi:hypothetical protein
MAASQDFTPREFFRLAKEVAAQEAELKIKLAKAGVSEDAGRKSGDKRESD